jgi:thiol:disulfide interchange protein DsbC
VTIRPTILTALAACVLIAAGIAAGQASKPDAKPEPKADDLRAQIAKRLEIKVEDVRPSPIAGLYEVRAGTEVGYVSSDGRYYVDGDVFDMTSRQNLTEDVRRKGRLEVLAGIKDQDAIVFAPKAAAQHTVTVFTDVDCVHCRRMHTEIAELNRLGIRVRYLMFPRGGPGSDAWAKAETVWCSADRRDALTRAKKGEKLQAGRCETPIAAQYELGRQLGVNGTPGIFTDKGEYLPGYASAAYLAAHLAEPAAATAAN